MVRSDVYSSILPTGFPAKDLSAYKVESLLGGGGFAHVVLARDVHPPPHDPGRPRGPAPEWALKLIPAPTAATLGDVEASAPMLLNEARIHLLMSQEPAILPCLEAFKSEYVHEVTGARTNMAVLRMPVAACSVEEWLFVAQPAPGSCPGGGRHVDEAEVLSVWLQMANAVYRCHLHGVMHKDVKLPNFLMDHRGRVQLMDFGLAQLEGVSPRQVAGTPWTMSPAAFKHGDDGRAGDWWSLGVVLYQLLQGGAWPFKACWFPWQKRGGERMDATIRRAVLAGRIHFNAPGHARISEPCKALIRGLLQPDPNRRWQLRQVLACDAISPELLQNVAKRFPELESNMRELLAMQARARGVQALGSDGGAGASALGIHAGPLGLRGLGPLGGLSLGLSRLSREPGHGHGPGAHGGHGQHVGSSTLGPGQAVAVGVSSITAAATAAISGIGRHLPHWGSAGPPGRADSNQVPLLAEEGGGVEGQQEQQQGGAADWEQNVTMGPWGQVGSQLQQQQHGVREGAAKEQEEHDKQQQQQQQEQQQAVVSHMDLFIDVDGDQQQEHTHGHTSPFTNDWARRSDALHTTDASTPTGVIDNSSIPTSSPSPAPADTPVTPHTAGPYANGHHPTALSTHGSPPRPPSHHPSPGYPPRKPGPTPQTHSRLHHASTTGSLASLSNTGELSSMMAADPHSGPRPYYPRQLQQQQQQQLLSPSRNPMAAGSSSGAIDPRVSAAGSEAGFSGPLSGVSGPMSLGIGSPGPDDRPSGDGARRYDRCATSLALRGSKTSLNEIFSGPQPGLLRLLQQQVGGEAGAGAGARLAPIAPAHLRHADDVQVHMQALGQRVRRLSHQHIPHQQQQQQGQGQGRVQSQPRERSIVRALSGTGLGTAIADLLHLPGAGGGAEPDPQSVEQMRIVQAGWVPPPPEAFAAAEAAGAAAAASAACSPGRVSPRGLGLGGGGGIRDVGKAAGGEANPPVKRLLVKARRLFTTCLHRPGAVRYEAYDDLLG